MQGNAHDDAARCPWTCSRKGRAPVRSPELGLPLAGGWSEDTGESMQLRNGHQHKCFTGHKALPAAGPAPLSDAVFPCAFKFFPLGKNPPQSPHLLQGSSVPQQGLRRAERFPQTHRRASPNAPPAAWSPGLPTPRQWNKEGAVLAQGESARPQAGQAGWQKGHGRRWRWRQAAP